MKRLFLAAWPDPEALSALEALQRELGKTTSASDSVRWVLPDQLHLTLHFLGELENDRLADLLYRLRSEDWAAFPPCEQVLDSLFLWPSAAQPRVIAHGATRPDGRLSCLYDRLSELIQAEGVWTEDRAFVPHVTLARRPGGTAMRTGSWVDLGNQFPPLLFSIRGFHLVESRQTPLGTVYEPLADFELSI